MKICKYCGASFPQERTRHCVRSKTTKEFRPIRRRLHNIWYKMKQRCFTPADPGYRWYGQRGITICTEWVDSFDTFYGWAVSNGYLPGLTIERDDVNGHYSPANCHWVPNREQAYNTRRNVNISAWGETKCVSEWGRDPRANFTYLGIIKRINRGVPPELAISGPRHPALSEDTARQILSMKNSGLSQAAIGKRFGVTGSSIGDIWARRAWKRLAS